MSINGMSTKEYNPAITTSKFPRTSTSESDSETKMNRFYESYYDSVFLFLSLKT